MKLRITIDVEYDPNGEDPSVLEREVEKEVFRAINDGMLTGATAAIVEDHSVKTEEPE